MVAKKSEASIYSGQLKERGGSDPALATDVPFFGVRVHRGQYNMTLLECHLYGDYSRLGSKRSIGGLYKKQKNALEAHYW